MKKTIKDYEYKGKRVILRCDLNVPIKDGVITDKTRIMASLKTINYLIYHDAKVIILSHLGKVKSQEDILNNTLKPVYLELKKLLKTNVYFSKENHGLSFEKMVDLLKERDVLLVENTRFLDYPDQLESNCDEKLSKYWASFGQIFISDAYGVAHRNHASNVGIAKYLPSAIGLLFEEEITKIDEIMAEDTHPFIVVLGGKKISDKTLVIDHLLKKCDQILLGGGMCFTFLASQGVNIGSSIIDNNNIEYARNVLKEYQNKIVLPCDVMLKDGNIKKISNLIKTDIGCDIGPETILLYQDILSSAKRVIVNGPMGIFEEPPFHIGTLSIYEVLANKHIKTLVGGGDSAKSVNDLGYQNCFYHVSTGGGATLEYLSGKKLPGMEAIDD